MEREVSNDVPTVDEFWERIEAVLATECPTHDDIDEALRSYLALLDTHYDHFITTEDHLAHCAYLLYASPLFAQNATYIRHQLVHCLLQEDDLRILRLSVTFLLADAKENDQTFELLNEQGVFPRLVELIDCPREDEQHLHRMLMELLYELARVQKITNDDLLCVSDEFVANLFDIIEQVSDDVNDPYHYPVIRVLLVLNEQFMVSASDPAVRTKKSMPLTNKVVKVLSALGQNYKIFGANIILLLNREDETSLQLLTLKLMYLLFTTNTTYEYFYTNDLRVLVDILIRNLLDLPEYAIALRHTYLRVLHPLLERTQLQHPPYYKRNEIRKLLAMLCGDRTENDDSSPPLGGAWNHFEDVDETTKRLVGRCRNVNWLADPEISEPVRVESPVDERPPSSPTSPTKPQPPQLPAPRKLKKRDSSKGSTLTIGEFLTPQLESARQSSISMIEMAQQKEKPGVITPSRKTSIKQDLRQAIFTKKEKPPPPKTRRSGITKPKLETSSPKQPEVETLDVPATPNIQKSGAEADAFEDAVEVQVTEHTETAIDKDEPHEHQKVKPKPPVARRSRNGTSHHQEEESTSLPKKPPPAPKARRGWRMRKSKDSNGLEEEIERDRGKEPGKFSTNLPSISTTVQSPFSPPIENMPEGSPFSPVKEAKTLDPLESARSPISPSSGQPKRSVSDAMGQAQAQAVLQVEECMENTHISDSPETEHHPRHHLHLQPHHPPRNSSLQHNVDHQSSPLQQTVLAPPGPTPIRAVPGPRVDVEKSPFLSDEEKDQETSTEDVAQPRVLKTKESWEDFDNEE